jgi:hypothetical protein
MVGSAYTFLLLVQLFREVRGHFVEAVSNPFATVGEKLTSPKFDRKVRSTVKARNRTWFTQ